MKNIITILASLLILIGCKSDDEQVNVELAVKTFEVIESNNSTTFQESQRFVVGKPIHIVVDVRNKLKKTSTLDFPSSQLYDVELVNDEGGKVWNWAADKVFGQALTEFILYSEEQRVLHDETLNTSGEGFPIVPVGKYTINAWLVNGDGNMATIEIEVVDS